MTEFAPKSHLKSWSSTFFDWMVMGSFTPIVNGGAILGGTVFHGGLLSLGTGFRGREATRLASAKSCPLAKTGGARGQGKSRRAHGSVAADQEPREPAFSLAARSGQRPQAFSKRHFLASGQDIVQRSSRTWPCTLGAASLLVAERWVCKDAL